MNELLKQSTNPRFSSVEEAIPEYNELIEYFKNNEVVPFLEDKKLSDLIYKVGFKSYQAINHSYAHTSKKGEKHLVSDMRNLVMERNLY